MPLSKLVKGKKRDQRVIEFIPQKLELATPSQALSYLKSKEEGSDFRMSDVVRSQTRVTEIEAQNFENAVENRVLERLKTLQENAYQEAHALGLQNGLNKAFEENSENIKQRLDRFDALIENMEQMKAQLLKNNEAQLVKLLVHMATRLAFAEIKADPTRIREVLTQAIELTQSDERLTLHLNPDDHNFLKTIKFFDKLHKFEIEIDPEIQAGGCIVETNHGSVDALIESRVEQLWEVVASNMYKIKDKISAA